MSQHFESCTLQLYISDEAMGVLNYLCAPVTDIRFEVTPSVLAVAWIARWARAPMAPGMSFLEDLQLHPLTLTLEGEPLDQVNHYAKHLGHPPATIAAAVVSARGAQIAWVQRSAPLGKGIPEPPPPYAGA